MKTTYDHISDNKKKTVLLFILFPLVFAVTAYFFIFLATPFLGNNEQIAYQMGYQSLYNGFIFKMANYYASYIVPICIAAAAIWIVVSLYTGDDMILKMANAREVHSVKDKEIYNLVDTVAISVGAPMPRVYIIEDNALNAFATGRTPEKSSIALTTGIIQTLNKSELEAVIAHEIAHIMNRDIRLMLITIAGISFFSVLGGIILRAALRSRGGKDGKGKLVLLVIGLFFILYGYLIAPLIRLALSRQREYQADASAAMMTRNPGALASALEKISGKSGMDVLKEQPAMAPMCIDSPPSAGIFDKLSGITSTHPPIEKRIAALRQMDGFN
ncbi:heat shock protein HtpX [Elusimicrobium posterum]|uniref:M48 family metallopeptidase n=1 Tax=Elusimicrobium posterum TaxID=3116653 RepID=UPI003C72211B